MQRSVGPPFTSHHSPPHSLNISPPRYVASKMPPKELDVNWPVAVLKAYDPYMPDSCALRIWLARFLGSEVDSGTLLAPAATSTEAAPPATLLKPTFTPPV